MLSRWNRGRERISDFDRSRAFATVDAMFAQGLIRNDDERKLRRKRIDSALYPHELAAALDGLPDAARRPADPVASDAERADAVRSIRIHESAGHLRSDEADRRVAIVEKARTVGAIDAVVADLPALDRPVAARRIASSQRDHARTLIDAAHRDQRLTDDERRLALAQVDYARTHSELNAAFRGLESPAAAARRQKAEAIGSTAAAVSRTAVTEGGRRLARALMRVALSVAVFLVGVVALFYNPLIGILCVSVSVVVGFSAVLGLFKMSR
jgi:hypothetical protein